MYFNGRGIELKLSAAATNHVTGPSKVKVGTFRNDVYHGVSGETLLGAAGDDTYNLWSSNVVVTEKAGEGIDTIVAQFAGKITLPNYVENLILTGKGMVAGTGNALDNIIIAGDVGAALDGGGGNDVLVGGIGSDLFKVSAGNGSDAIMNFVSGQDAVKLSGYGVTSFAQLLSLGKQVGNDVKFTFANNESLVLRDVKLGDLKGYDFGFEMDKAPVKPTDTVMEGAGRAQNHNGWYVFNNSYGTGNLKQGTDFTISSTFNKADATAGTTFSWKMPYTTGESPRILAYPEVIFGVPPMGAHAKNPGDKLAVFPVKVSDLVSLKADYDVTFGGNVSGFNVAYDIWLTSKPNGDKSTITNEIMVWVHKGDVPMSAKEIGTYAADGVTYKIYNQGVYTAFIADRDVPKGELDIAAMLTHLKKLGIVKDSSYLASIELGAEVISGVGSLTINNLDLEVASRNADGSIVVKDVTGSGQTKQEVPLIDTLFKAGTDELVSDKGQVIGKTVTTVENNAATQKFYDANGRVIAIEKTTAYPSGDIKTEYMTASWAIIESRVERRTSAETVNLERYSPTNKFLGADAITTKANGEVITAQYDAAWKFTGAQSVQTKANGDTTTIHFDKAWKITGSESVVTQPNGDVITHYFDANYKLIRADAKTVDAQGAVSIHHFDAQWKLTGMDKTVTNADGSVWTYHFNEKFAITSTEVEKIAANGVKTTTSYDGNWRVTSTEFIGTAADDAITGTSGNNVLRGGYGWDTLRGGAGADSFVFDTAIGKDVDKVLGFDVTKDKIVLDKAIFDKLAVGALAGDVFVAGTAAKDANDRIIYDAKSGSLYYDADGSGSGAAILFAKLDPKTALTAANFQVVADDPQYAPTSAIGHAPASLLQHAYDYL